jgi:hypothetical protein
MKWTKQFLSFLVPSGPGSTQSAPLYSQHGPQQSSRRISPGAARAAPTSGRGPALARQQARARASPRRRNRNPSIPILQSLARALNLDHAATEHLMRLAAPRPPATRRRLTRPEVPKSIALLLESIELPAFVEDRHFDVLASNRLAEALSPTFKAGKNRLISVFLDPEEQALFAEWESVTAEMVAAFRTSVADAADDVRTVELVGELSLTSQRFRELWARHDVRPRVGAGTSRLRHPQLGELKLMREKLVISAPVAQLLVIWHPHPGSEAAEQLALLKSMAASFDPSSQPGASVSGGPRAPGAPEGSSGAPGPLLGS